MFLIVFFTAPSSVLIWRDIFSVQGSFPLFETLVTKSNTLQSQIISTVSCLSSFLDSLQMIADNASNSKGEPIWEEILVKQEEFEMLHCVTNHDGCRKKCIGDFLCCFIQLKLNLNWMESSITISIELCLNYSSWLRQNWKLILIRANKE